MPGKTFDILTTIAKRYTIIFIKKLIFWRHGMRLIVGQTAPDFTLPSHLNKEIALSSLKGKTLVLAFFPQAWTPI
jgi:peroxiredoxin